MKKRYLLIAIILIVINFFIAFLLAYIAGTMFIDIEYEKKLMTWRATGEFPYPKWLIFVFPRLTVWHIRSEIVYQIFQGAIWVLNGYFLKRYFPSLKLLNFLWIPLIIHLPLKDPIQAVIGTTILYLTIRKNKKT